jgi:uncharacterized protein YcbK (DUF882 family)
LAGLACAAHGTQDAIANGDTRSLTFLHAHRNDTVTVTFRRNGRYDPDGLNQLNYFLRDWRTDEATKMDPRLFDIIWEVYREVGSREPVVVLSAYRSPETNAMLRRRSRAVSEHSQHMAGKAMDIRMPDVDMARVRAVGMRLQDGGVGYYPSSNFVHLDAGSVRAWPRMTQDQLARLFPDGKTVHMPSNGKPFARYEEARAEILSRGGAVAGQSFAGAGDGASTGRRSLWATLFGGGDDEDADYYRSSESGRVAVASRASTVTAYAPVRGGGDDSGRIVLARSAGPETSENSGGGFGFRNLWRRDSAEPAATAPLEADTPPGQALALAPMPPRRPDEMTGSLFADAPLPPARPTELAALGAIPLPPMRTEPKLATDDRASLRALFATAAATPAPAPQPARIAISRAKPQPILSGVVVADLGPALNLRFSLGSASELSPTAFTGPAVKPLPVLR